MGSKEYVNTIGFQCPHRCALLCIGEEASGLGGELGLLTTISIVNFGEEVGIPGQNGELNCRDEIRCILAFGGANPGDQ